MLKIQKKKKNAQNMLSIMLGAENTTAIELNLGNEKDKKK